jgi:geranylgeranyl pyrophosphate synthase
VGATGAIERSREVAREYAERARACLDGAPCREELEAIVDAVVERTS